jgi:hypothetical protein
MAKGKAKVGETAGVPAIVNKVPGVVQAATTIAEYTVVGKADGVEYLATTDGAFGILFHGKPTGETKYHTPCFHFGGRGADRPVFKVTANGETRNFAVNPGTLSIVPDAETKRVDREAAKVTKLLSGLSEETLARVFTNLGADVKVEG